MSDIKLIDRLMEHYEANKGPFRQGYGRFLPEYRSLNPCILLEIGVAKGGSLRAWQEYFDHPDLFAIDIKAECFENAPPNVRGFVGDQSDRDFLATVVAATGPLDVVIDDGSHRPDHQQISFEALWPHVRPGGLYVIEDMESSLKELWSRKRRWKHIRNPTGATPTPDWLYAKARGAICIFGRVAANSRRPPKINTMYSFFSTACFITKEM